MQTPYHPPVVQRHHLRQTSTGRRRSDGSKPSPSHMMAMTGARRTNTTNTVLPNDCHHRLRQYTHNPSRPGFDSEDRALILHPPRRPELVSHRHRSRERRRRLVEMSVLRYSPNDRSHPVMVNPSSHDRTRHEHRPPDLLARPRPSLLVRNYHPPLVALPIISRWLRTHHKLGVAHR